MKAWILVALAGCYSDVRPGFSAPVGLATEPVTFAPARAPPQADLPWDDAT